MGKTINTPIGAKPVRETIVMSSEEFEVLLHDVYGDEVQTEYSADGLWVGNDWGELPFEEDLSELLGRKISSIHIDDCDYVGVWIVFEQEA